MQTFENGVPATRFSDHSRPRVGGLALAANPAPLRELLQLIHRQAVGVDVPNLAPALHLVHLQEVHGIRMSTFSQQVGLEALAEGVGNGGVEGAGCRVISHPGQRSFRPLDTPDPGHLEAAALPHERELYRLTPPVRRGEPGQHGAR